LTQASAIGIESYFGDGERRRIFEAEMPGDPKECRQHALTCVRLAQTSASPQAREQFADLARTWIKLADDLERTLAFFDALNEETEPQRQTGWVRVETRKQTS
jgi:hypothetical protein